jgi:hypothetical protein
MRRFVIVLVLIIVAVLIALGLYFGCGRKPAPLPPQADAAPRPVQVDAARPPPQVDAAVAQDAAPKATAAVAAVPREPREPREPRDKPEPPPKPEPEPKPEPKKPEPQADAGPQKDAAPRQFDKLGPAPAPVERKLGHATARVRNRMGTTFLLQRVVCELDGEKVFERSGNLSGAKDLATFDKTLVPGQHKLVVRMLYRGAGFGVFKYLEGYHIDATNDFTFTVNPGYRTDISVEAVEKPGASLKWQDKPLINFSSKSTVDKK